MSARSSARAAYDAWWATAKGVPKPPDVPFEDDAEAWEAAAAAGRSCLAAETEAVAASLILEAANQRKTHAQIGLANRLDGLARRLVNAASAREALED